MVGVCCGERRRQENYQSQLYLGCTYFHLPIPAFSLLCACSLCPVPHTLLSLVYVVGRFLLTLPKEVEATLLAGGMYFLSLVADTLFTRARRYGIEPAPAANLIQPILAYGYTGAEYSIFNGYYQWDDGYWYATLASELICF